MVSYVSSNFSSYDKIISCFNENAETKEILKGIAETDELINCLMNVKLCINGNILVF